ncbi:MAG: glycosyltransferase [Rhodomicrobiaceae bacterium]
MFAFGETFSNYAPTLLVIGLALLVLPFIRPTQPVMRALLVAATIILTWRYMAWRLTETVHPLDSGVNGIASWAFAGLETLSAISATVAGLFLLRYKDRRSEATHYAEWWSPGPPPPVDVFIATYNEDREILERTIAGAKHLAYPNARIHVLDDGRRLWLAALCTELGVSYIARTENSHAKAGNINSAFAQRMADPDPPGFILVLDADFVPHRDFIDRAIALFHDSRVGLVQTPQCFFNPDPIQHNLDIAAAYPDEQRFFFDHVEPSHDAWGTAICCGTSSMVRTQALTEIGGVPTQSVTEDFLLTLRLSEDGWKTVYLNEPLSEGLAPEGLKEYVTQRARWCLGLMQISRDVYNPFSMRHRLGFGYRLAVFDSFLYWTSTPWFRCAALAAPLLYWYFGIIVVNAAVPDIIYYFLPSYIATLCVLNWLSRGLLIPFVSDVGQVLTAWPLTRASIAGLMPGGAKPFKVTAKGGDRSEMIVQWPFLRVFAVLFALTLGGLCLPLVSDQTHLQEAGDGRFVILGWSIYNLLVLALTMAVCFERPRFSHPMNHAPETAGLWDGEMFAAGWAFELSADRARIRGPSGLNTGETTILRLDDIGDVSARIEKETPEGYILRLDPSSEQKSILLAKLHTASHAPGVHSGAVTGIAAGLLRLVMPKTS